MLYSVFLTKSLVSVVLISLTFSTYLSYSVILTTSVFTTLLSWLKSTGIVSNFPISNPSNLRFKLVTPLGKLSNESTPYFKLAKSTFLAKSDLSTPAALLNLFLQNN